MANQRIYTITINGLKESIDSVESLNKQLDNLDKRINSLQSQNIKLNTSSGGKSALSEEEAIQREINKLKKEGETLDAKIVAAQDEVYKKVDATKQLYKETVADQKAMAAEERLIANTYSNTMQGMKAHLADLKAAINTTDLGDADKINKMTKEANELTNKLKEMEQAYGQFGRNVGNYQDAANGFKGISFEIAGTVQEFDNAKQALKTLQGELRTLQVKKDQGMILSEEEVQRFKELPNVVAELKSSIQDAGKPMDALMDTMQSIVAIAQTAKGFSAFFGFDSDEIERSIQKLVALQNAMQGLQTIQKQLQSGEGFGGWIKKASSAMDAFAASITKTDKAAKYLSLTLKGISLLAIIAAVYQLVKGLSDLKKKQEEINNATEEGVKAYAKAESELSALKTKLDNFNGSKKQEEKLVKELNSKYGTSLGQYKSLKEWKDALIKKGTAYCQVLQKEAEMQALMNIYTENYIKLQKARQAQEQGQQDTVDLILKMLDGQASIKQVLASIKDDFKAPLSDDLSAYNDELKREVNELDKNGKDIMEKVKKLQTEIAKLNEENELNDYSDQIDKNTNKTKDRLEEAQRELNQLELRLMQDGLNKKLRQLDEEERQTINKLKENGRKSSDEIQKIQRTYAALRIKEIKEYIKNLETTISESAKNIESIKFEINTSRIKNKIDSLKNDMEQLKKLDMTESSFQPLKSRNDLKEEGIDVDDKLTESFRIRYDVTSKFYDKLIQELIKYQEKEQTLIKENIKEEEKIQRKAEGERYSAQISGLTATKEKIEDSLKAIQEKYGEITKEGAIVVEESNKKISEDTLNSYRDLEGKLQEINGQIEDAKQQHKDKLQEITNSANNAIKKNELDTAKDISTTQEKYYNLQISNYREFLSKLNDEVNNNPVADKNWGIVNVAQTKKNYNEIINAAKEAVKSIDAEIEKVSNDPLLTDEAVGATLRQLNDIKKDINQGVAVTEEASKNLIADFISSTQMYLQAVMDSFNTIMNAVWDAQDIAFEKEQEQIDKDNEALDKALDKQQDIIQQHKDAIDDIEDELATSRGDRRQHLIDQLNAEMEAQRAAAADEKRLQKEKEKQQEKQDELDKKRKKAEYDRQILQAIVNGAMAVTMAAINNWPIPAVPLMALAASTTAAQIAIMKANKPYRVGGQLDGGLVTGKRHTQGGVPVGNTGIEVEGSEYIIRRESTTPNLNLLDFINKSQKKLDLSDFVEFYSDKPKKVIKNINKKMYADGGYLPTLPSDIDIKEQLRDIYVMQDQRPVVVSVVDITNKQNDVRRVQTLAGLSD